MQTLIVNHYPPVIRKLKEIEQIANAEDIEFSKLRLSMNNVSRNMFILTADKIGIQKFEHLFGITPKVSQSLEERRTIILFQANRRKMSLSELYTMLSEYLGIQFDIDKNKMKLEVTASIDEGNVEILRNVIDEILPLNIYFILGYHNGCYVDTKQEMSVIFTMAFYPLFNLPKLRLNGKWKLNGKKKLSGYDGSGRIDLYPVGMEFKVPVREEVKEAAQLTFLLGAQEQAKTGNEMEIKTLAACQGKVKEEFTLQTAAKTQVKAGNATLYNAHRLDGKRKLNGSLKLNGGFYQL